jgi:hypothetical protein
LQFYELATLTVPVGLSRGEPLAAIMQAIEGWLGQPGIAGALLGSWVIEFGPQNRIVLLRAFESREQLEHERMRVLDASNPFGCGDRILGLALEAHAQFPDLPPVRPASLGPLYEFRTYVLKTGGLMPTLSAWAPVIPQRTALSPLAVVMYALDGPPRFTHVWAYRSFEERLAIRADAFASGVWPAKGAPEWLTTEMKSELYWPTETSPLQ